MIDAKRADEIAESWLAAHGEAIGEELAWSGGPSDHDIGWLYVWNSRRYVDTGDFMTALMGNAPIVVLRTTGEVHSLPTGIDIDDGLQQLRNSLER